MLQKPGFCESQMITWGVHKVLWDFSILTQWEFWHLIVVKKNSGISIPDSLHYKLAELGFSESGLCLCSPALGQGPMANHHAVFWRFFCKASSSLVLFSTKLRNFRKSEFWFLPPLLSRIVFLVLYILVSW